MTAAPGNSSTFQLRKHLQPHFEGIYFLCPVRETGDGLLDLWHWHGSTKKYFSNKNICSQYSRWTWTAMLTHARNNHQHSVLRILKPGWSWVFTTQQIKTWVSSHELIGKPLAKLPLDIYFDKQTTANDSWKEESRQTVGIHNKPQVNICKDSPHQLLNTKFLCNFSWIATHRGWYYLLFCMGCDHLTVDLLCFSF